MTTISQKIDQGLKDVEAGRTISEEEFDQRMAECLEPWDRLKYSLKY